MSNFMDAALEHVAAGRNVIPIKNEGTNKTPTVLWKEFQAKRVTEDQIRKWFARDDLTGLAVIVGKVSGNLACRDFDSKESYFNWAQDHARLAMVLPTVSTSRGYHVYFSAADEWLGFEKCGDGEYRAKGIICLLPPSIHPNGVVYSWKNGSLTTKPPLLINPLTEGLTNGTKFRANVTQEDSCGVGGLVDSCETLVSSCVTPLDEIIKNSLPKVNGERRECIFRLIRVLKSLPEYVNTDPASLEGIVREWHKQALPAIATKPFDDTFVDFVEGWKYCKFPIGTGPTYDLMRKAKDMDLSPELEQFDNPLVRQTGMICRELQEKAGDNPFFLGCRTLQRVLGANDPETALRCLKRLKITGLLREVEKGSLKNGCKATTWRYCSNQN
jgi:hypothetical protein